VSAFSFGFRPYHPSDVLAHWAAARESVESLQPWLPWCHQGYTPAESAVWVLSRDHAWNTGTEYSFVITDVVTGTFVGSVGLGLAGQPTGCANLGYWVRSAWQRRGAATAAIRYVARFGITTLRLQRIEIIAAAGNLVSQAAAVRAGARREGVLRRRMLLHGTMHDAVILSLIGEDLAEAV
jgi:RimJ/RimL family protein N-acetyltransferase